MKKVVLTVLKIAGIVLLVLILCAAAGFLASTISLRRAES